MHITQGSMPRPYCIYNDIAVHTAATAKMPNRIFR